MNEPSEAQILAALDESGYLFEQEVADSLEAHEFHVETSWAFRDLDSDKSREIDVKAVRRLVHDEVNKVAIFVELLVECKAFDSPLVFLERPKNQREILHVQPSEYVFPVREYRRVVSPTSYEPISPFDYLDLRGHHYFYSENMKATQFSKIVRKGEKWTANHDGIYDSLILPLAKLLEFRRASVVKDMNGSSWKYVWLFFPMVVLRQSLFALNLSESSRKLEARNRISFVRHIQSGNLTGFYLTDFVVFSHLHNFIRNELMPFADQVVEIHASDPKKLLNSNP